MKATIYFILTVFFGMIAFAGFQAKTSSANLGLVSTMSCGSGLTCTKSGATLNLSNAAYGTLRNRILATATTLTSSQCGSTVYNSGAVVINLPEASTVLGCRFTFITLNASNFDINPDDADIIMNSTNVAGDASRNATVGDNITLEAISATQWTVISSKGTWSDAN